MDYTIEKTIAVIGTDKSGEKVLSLVKWGRGAAKLDLRTWYTDADGNRKAGKGMTLTGEEAARLSLALIEYTATEGLNLDEE